MHDQTTENDVSYLNFSNIRYAAPPTGNLRFAAPVRPSSNRIVQDGQITSICPQAQPGWITTAQEFTTGEPITTYRNYTVSDIPPVDPRTSEDCLFLNVLVSSAVYERRGNSTGAAVLVWIHGGGFTIGWKGEFGSGQEFIALSAGNRDDGVVYVAINYRLGLFVIFITNTTVYAATKTFYLGLARRYIGQTRCRGQCRSSRPAFCTGLGADIHPPFRRRSQPRHRHG